MHIQWTALGAKALGAKALGAKALGAKALGLRSLGLKALGISALIAALLLYSPFVLSQTGGGNSEPATALFQQVLETHREEYQFPGATAAYVLANGTSGTVSTGYADLESNTQMLPSSRMLAASIGKTFVAATVLSLAQEDKLNLDDPISLFLGNRPWFDQLANAELISIRHLLMHRSGIPNHVDNPAFAKAFSERWSDPENFFTPEILVGFVLSEPALFSPGEAWSYSDTGYILLGLIIEEVAGRSFYQEVSSRFLVPLELKSTSPSNRRNLPGLASGYMSEDNPFQLPEKTIGEDGLMVWNPAIEWTGGGFVSTSLDLARWGNALFEAKAMDGPYLEDLLFALPVSPDNSEVQFGAGIAIRDAGILGKSYSHGGWIPGYSSSFRYYPEYKAAISFQINTDIGIVDDSTDLYGSMVSALEQVIAGIEK